MALAADARQGDVAHVALHFFVAQCVDVHAAGGGEQYFDPGFCWQRFIGVDQLLLGGKQEVFLELVVLFMEQVLTQLGVMGAEIFNDFAQCRSGALKGRFRQLGHANQNVGERDSVHGQLRVQVVERLKGEMLAIPGKQLGAQGLALTNIHHQVTDGEDRLAQEQRLVLVFVTEIGAHIRV